MCLHDLSNGAAEAFLAGFGFQRVQGLEKYDTALHEIQYISGEFFEIASTVGLLVTVQLVYPDVHWLALFIGLVVALKANLFAFLVKT